MGVTVEYSENSYGPATNVRETDEMGAVRYSRFPGYLNKDQALHWIEWLRRNDRNR